MVGLDLFKEHFKEYTENYIVIGGAACDNYFQSFDLDFRRTDDIDIILVVEAVDDAFIEHFWEFIKAGKYEKEEQTEELQYYRFSNPETAGFPVQLELFSRTPDLITPIEEGRFTPIPANEDLSSLSAILMDDDYYAFTKAQTEVQDDLRRANAASLICLKAKAYLDLKERREQGQRVDSRSVNKHRSDVFRLAVTLTPGSIYELPESVKANLQSFVDKMSEETPHINGIMKSLGVPGNIKAESLLTQLRTTFKLN